MTQQKIISVGGHGAREVSFGNQAPLSIIAGPCALESLDHALYMSQAIKEIADKLGIGVIYKTSLIRPIAQVTPHRVGWVWKKACLF